MDKKIKTGIIGDFDASRESQLKTGEALTHASNKLSINLSSEWIPTKSLNSAALESKISSLDAVWAGPGNYENPEGVIDAIQYCREKGVPFLGT